MTRLELSVRVILLSTAEFIGRADNVAGRWAFATRLDARSLFLVRGVDWRNGLFLR